MVGEVFFMDKDQLGLINKIGNEYELPQPEEVGHLLALAYCIKGSMH